MSTTNTVTLIHNLDCEHALCVFNDNNDEVCLPLVAKRGSGCGYYMFNREVLDSFTETFKFDLGYLRVVEVDPISMFNYMRNYPSGDTLSFEGNGEYLSVKYREVNNLIKCSKCLPADLCGDVRPKQIKFTYTVGSEWNSVISKVNQVYNNYEEAFIEIDDSEIAINVMVRLVDIFKCYLSTLVNALPYSVKTLIVEVESIPNNTIIDISSFNLKNIRTVIIKSRRNLFGMKVSSSIQLNIANE